MRRLLLWVLLVACVSALALFLADRPGTLRAEWMGWRVTVSTSLVVGSALLLLVAAMWVAVRLAQLWLWPERRRNHRQLVRQQLGLRALTRAATALTVGDAEGAKKQIARARRTLQDAPLALLMQAQWHEKQGEGAKAAQLYHRLSAHEDTARLGLRGLLKSAEQQKDFARALTLARESLAEFPKDRAMLTHVLELQLRQKEPDEALTLLGSWRARRLIPSRERAHYGALAHVMKAESAEDEAARLPLLARARAMAPWHTHIALSYLDTLLALGSSHARSELATQWRAGGSAALTALTLRWLATLPERKRARAMRKLAALAGETLEGALLQAYDAKARGELMEARAHAEEALDLRESPRALELVRDIEEATGTPEKAALWQDRLKNAPAEEVWICGDCGRESAQWSLFCPDCEACDTQSLGIPAQRHVRIEAA